MSKGQGKLIIVSAPTGGGKSTLCRMLLKDHSNISYSISYTTRPARDTEVDRKHYHFISDQEFQRKISEGFFAEWAKVHAHLYGTSNEAITEVLASGKHVLMDLDVQGAKNLKTKFPTAVTIFIMPPSIEEVRKRVVARDRGATDNLELRIANAQKEMALAPQFQYQIINDDIDRAYASLKNILDKELKS